MKSVADAVSMTTTEAIIPWQAITGGADVARGIHIRYRNRLPSEMLFQIDYRR